MKWNLITLVIIGIFLLSSASADLGTYKQSQNVSIRANINATSVNTTIYFPNSSIADLNQAMTNTYGDIWTYNFTETEVLGTYRYDFCDQDGSNCKEDSFTITSTGDEFSTAGAIVLWIAVFFFLLLGAFLFTGFTNKENKSPIRMSYLLGSYLGFLASMNFISIFIGSASTNQAVVSFFDSFTAILFIIFWFAAGILAVMWGVTFFQTMVWRKNKRKLEKFG